MDNQETSVTDVTNLPPTKNLHSPASPKSLLKQNQQLAEAILQLAAHNLDLFQQIPTQAESQSLIREFHHGRSVQDEGGVSQVHSKEIFNTTGGGIDERLQAALVEADEMKLLLKEIGLFDDDHYRSTSPFDLAVMDAPLPSGFDMPLMDLFDGTTDLSDHVDAFQSKMYLYAVTQEIMCRAFPATLQGPARVWFIQLPPNTIHSFAQLAQAFIDYFSGAQRYRKQATSLIGIGQGSDESLRAYINRFNHEALQIDEEDERIVMTAFLGGLQPSRFLFAISEDPPEDMSELIRRAQRYVGAEKVMESRRSHTPGGPPESGEKEKAKPANQSGIAGEKT